jgi:ABC-2 type transport system permease protein
MTGLAGTGQLSRLAFRRDGVVLLACVFGIAALLAITARDLGVLYPTAASRLAVAAKASANPALRFLLGRPPLVCCAVRSAWRGGCSGRC